MDYREASIGSATGFAGAQGLVSAPKAGPSTDIEHITFSAEQNLETISRLADRLDRVVTRLVGSQPSGKDEKNSVRPVSTGALGDISEKMRLTVQQIDLLGHSIDRLDKIV